MKKTLKKFDKIRAICGEIQTQNEKRNPEHKEAFIFLAKVYKDDDEVLHGAIDAEEGDISRMLVLAMENDKLFAKEVIRATRDYQAKQMSKGIQSLSEALRKLTTPKYPSGGIISGIDHAKGKDEKVITCYSLKKEKNFGDLFEVSENPISDFLMREKIYYLINCGNFEKKEIQTSAQLYEIIKKNLTIYKSKK